MEVDGIGCTRFYVEQDGQWYKVVTATIPQDKMTSTSHEGMLELLTRAGFQHKKGEITRETDAFMGVSTFCQKIPVSRQVVDEDCAVPQHTNCRCVKPQMGGFQTVEDMRQWMKNGCPM